MFENLKTALNRLRKLNRGEPLVFFRVPIINSPPPDRYNRHYGIWKEQSEISMNDWDAILEGTKEFMSESCLRSVKGTGRSQHAKSV